MNNTVLKRIFEFLAKKEQQNPPFIWKIKNNIPFTKEELNIEGDLSLSYSNITSLPEGLKVGGNFSLVASKITSLPKGLKVGGRLDLLYSLHITSLPEGLEVRGDLDLYSTYITSLPEGLEVGGNLYINATPLKKYTDEELRDMIKPGFIKGEIIR